jgi:hypothetical protein
MSSTLSRGWSPLGCPDSVCWHTPDAAPGAGTERRFVVRRGEDYVIGLWYGSEAQWVKNVLAAGGCELQTRGRSVRLADPRVSADPSKRVLPLPLRWAGSLVGLTDFLRLRAVA